MSSMNSDDDVAADLFTDDEDDRSAEFLGDDFPDYSQLDNKAANVLNLSDVRRLQQEAVNRVSSLLSVSKSAASILLRHHACGICFDDFPRSEVKFSTCDLHPYCTNCWIIFIKTSIDNGIGCLTLRCPDPSCKAAIDEEIIELLASEEDKKKYDTYLCRSYIESNRLYKWCPGPDCEYAVRWVCDVNDENYDVSCLCSFRFCWNCMEDAHRPVDCETVRKWMAKNKSEGENTEWILTYTKPCPSCKKPIEKNKGCMHMRCRCGASFCWLCLQLFSNRQHLNCNGFQLQKSAYKEDDPNVKEERAKASLLKYTHYYERWAANEKSRRKAMTDFEKLKGEEIIEMVCDIHSQTDIEVKFISEAWQQIVECRRMLKWSYAYGYYLPEEEGSKRHLFEHLQGQAEGALERLHHVAETELKRFVYWKCDGFHSFKAKLVGLTNVAKSYFENFVTALENGLAEVDGDENGGRLSKKAKHSI